MMTHSLIAAVVALLVTNQSTHEEINPVYRQLREQGVQVAGESMTLAAPLMHDGMTAAEQGEALESLIGGSYSLDRFLRKSAVAPQILQLAGPEELGVDVRRADTYFVAYGDLDALTREDTIKRLLNSAEEDDDVGGEGSDLNHAELVSRGIELDVEDPQHEAYGHGTFELLKRVEVEATVRSYWSRTDDSLLAAVYIDPRFTDDPKFPNLWRSISRDNSGQILRGPQDPYYGMGIYLKLTRLASPEGALFVEWHLVFSEPHGWFDGANLLGSKLPAIVQNRVRAARREMARVE